MYKQSIFKNSNVETVVSDHKSIMWNKVAFCQKLMRLSRNENKS